MGLNRDFFLYAEHKDGAPVTEDEGLTICRALERKYDGWEGRLADRDALTISGVNWYNYDEDMRALSEEFPDILFTLNCCGMDLDDIWDAGFCDGRMDIQYASVPPLNKAYLLTGDEPETHPFTLRHGVYSYEEIWNAGKGEDK